MRSSEEIEKRREQLVNKTFVLALQLLVIFGVPVIIAFFVGRYIDTRFDIRPQGTLGAGAIAFVVSWSIVIYKYKQLTKEFQELKKEEESKR